jgi:hypothetical protein
MPHMLGVYTIVERKSEEHPDRKNLWIHIGIAFINRDGSINVRLNALPVDGKLHIREMKSEEAATEPDDGSFT